MALIVNIQRQPGANVTCRRADAIKALLPSLQSSLPPMVNRMTMLTDRTNTIRASVRDVEFELCLAVVLVILVIFIFLRSLWATVIPSLSVPPGRWSAPSRMPYLLHSSASEQPSSSLMALTIATGFAGRATPSSA